MKTLLFSLFILLLVGAGAWLKWGDKVELPSFLKKISAEPGFTFTAEEICELLSYDADGKAGYLIEKGYKEKAHASYEKYWGFEDQYALFPIGNTARIVIPTDPDISSVVLHLVFNKDEKEAYLKFLSQFPEIANPLPKLDGENKNTQKICNTRYVLAWGFKREANGYVVYLGSH